MQRVHAGAGAFETEIGVLAAELAGALQRYAGELARGQREKGGIDVGHSCNLRRSTTRLRRSVDAISRRRVRRCNRVTNSCTRCSPVVPRAPKAVSRSTRFSTADVASSMSGGDRMYLCVASPNSRLMSSEYAPAKQIAAFSAASSVGRAVEELHPSGHAPGDRQQEAERVVARLVRYEPYLARCSCRSTTSVML